MSELNKGAIKLFSDPNCAQLAVVRPDRTAQVHPVWVHSDGKSVFFNTAVGRAKHRYIELDPRVTLHVSNPRNPFEWVSITGRAEMTTDGADDQIDELSQKYIGQTPYPYRAPDEVRIKVTVRPDKVEYFSA